MIKFFNQIVDINHCASLVRLLLLTADANLLPCDDTEHTYSVRQCLLPVFDVLQLANTHVYISKAKIERAMLVIVNVVDMMGVSDGMCFLNQCKCVF